MPALVYCGVTVTVATTGVTPVFTAVNTPMLPVPAEASPMEERLLVQVNTVPATAPVKFTAAVEAPLHTTWLVTAFTVGVGLTVTVKVIFDPVHPLKVGVTTMVATTAAVPVLVAVNAGIKPVPLAAMPMDGALLVQL